MELLKVEGITKSFGPVKALKGVSLAVQPGQVHAVIGENGAGKSTLMKILSGAEKPDSGRIIFQGKAYQPHSPAEGRLAGIAMIYQELTLAPHLNAEENILLGIERSSGLFVKNESKRIREALQRLGLGDLDLRKPVGQFSIAVQQLIEIARALVLEARLVILDEPTSSLTAADTEALFAVIRQLRSEGISIIYISHFLEEVKQISDSYTIIRDGETVGHGDMATASINHIIELMVGRPLEDIYPHATHSQGEPLLHVKGLKGKGLPRSASFTLHRGEIMGLAGLVGAGRTELIRCLFGLDGLSDGSITIKEGKTVATAGYGPARALRAGMDLLSENRKEEGLALNLPIYQNMTLSALRRISRGGFINLKKEKQLTDEWRATIRVKCRDVEQPVGALSGGNQQKVCLARMLNYNNDILFLDEPTRGIDVGSKAEIYRMIHDLAAQGKAIVVISSYLPELLGICDSLAVMYRGELSPKLPIGDWTEQRIMHFATSGQMQEPAMPVA